VNGRVKGGLGTKTDQRIVEVFVLNELSRTRGEAFAVTARPDQTERQREAVEAIATGQSGRTVAIEHTLLQDFPGERGDAARLRAAIAPLEQDPGIRLARADLLVAVEPFAVPAGVDWATIPISVAAYLAPIKDGLPEGWSRHIVHCAAGFDLALEIERAPENLPGVPGAVFVARSWPGTPLAESAEIALKRKLAKLVATGADTRILLLERLAIPMGLPPERVREAIEVLRPSYPALEQIDEIWVAYTQAWTREDVVWYRIAWQK
jgi:hypothetical protein